MRVASVRLFWSVVLLAAAGMFVSLTGAPRQAGPATETIRAISPPTRPLPAESASAGVKKFSFIAYGDTRGRRDGTEIQYEHSLVVDSMMATIKALDSTEYPVRFVLQSGDSVVNGRDPKQWNRSFVDLINRLTTGAGVPYYLSPGNHDVTSADNLDAPGRQTGLRNYLDAVAQLIPPDGAARRLDGFPTYAFGYGNLFCVAIDSAIASNDTQFAWIKQQLEGLDRVRYPNVIALFHHPPFSSGPHGGSTIEAATAAMRARYEPLFRQHHVRMTITGHEHLYEHWVERYQDGAARYRIDHLVTGGGGAPLYGYQGEPNLREFLAAGAVNKVALEHLVKPGASPGDNPYHYVVVKVDGDDMELDVVGIDWGKGFAPYRSTRTQLGDRR
jgi:hypothetical protein